ncbi:MAG: hypothetical protein MZW92_36070 [Comamonadaceae bacterium]|nr:hypothetical protein [Comamonadaceae bacterium]
MIKIERRRARATTREAGARLSSRTGRAATLRMPPTSSQPTAARSRSRSTSPAGRAATSRVTWREVSDVLVENFKVAATSRATAWTTPRSRRTAPASSTVPITGFGQDGPVPGPPGLRLH